MNPMPRPGALLKRLLIFVHRWLGVALSIIFGLWFVSGIVMMYWSYPSVTARDRMERAPALRAEQVVLSAEEALAALGRSDAAPTQLRLTSFDGRPVYRVSGGGRGGGRGRGTGPSMVYADTGTPPSAIDAALIDRVAAAWAVRPAEEAEKLSVEEIDQWMIGGGLRNVRPLFKYTWPDGQQVYVNGNTAEVAQYTTTASRFWAYLGAIPHWMYFTPLRTQQRAWFNFVVYSSLIGTIGAILGVVIGVWMYSPRKRYRHAGTPTSIPYRGWKRWHTIVGLSFGVITVTWTFSGLLSMGPFPITDRLTELTVPFEPSVDEADSFDPGAADVVGPLTNALAGDRGALRYAHSEKHPREAIASLADFDVKELEWSSFGGEPVYLAQNGRGETRIVPVRGEPRASFDVDEMLALVRGAAGDRIAELRVMDQYDAYYRDRHRERPLPVIYLRINDALGTRYYIDPKTARIVGSYNARNWISRWLYNGLHSLDFPWLYNHRPLWDIVVITLMLGGTALCVTSLVLTWRVLARKVAGLVSARMTPANEDLSAPS
jgi:uncharacterized iron-regulated membrane protein